MICIVLWVGVVGGLWVKGISGGNVDGVLEIGSQDRTRGNGYKPKWMLVGSLTEW